MKQSASTTFRKRLRELRETLRWTQKRTAKACSIGHKLYQLYEIGVKKNPGLLTLEKIAKGFGMEVHELLAPVSTRTRKRSPLPKTKRNHKRGRRGKKRM
jgi:transcriptional regulator with XRE-family HTH domain